MRTVGARSITAAVVAAAVLAVAACGESSDGSISITATTVAATTASSTRLEAEAEPEPAVTDPRLVGNVQHIDVDLTEPLEAADVASVLEFLAGSGGTDECDEVSADDSRLVAPGLGFVGAYYPVDAVAPILTSTIATFATVCLFGWPEGTEVSVVGPTGAAAAVRTAAMASAVTTGMSLHVDVTPEMDAQSIRIRTYAGASTGTYAVSVVADGRDERFDVEFGSMLDDVDGWPRLFNVDRYEEAAIQDPLSSDGATAYSVVGYPPHSDVELAIFRTELPADDTALATSTLFLVDRVVLTTDERGEGTIAFDLDPTTAGHCFFAIPVDDLAEADLSDGTFRAVAGMDQRTFCVQP